MGRVYGVVQPPMRFTLVKIGRTTKTVAERMRGNLTFQPQALTVAYDEEVPNHKQVEHDMHEFLAGKQFRVPGHPSNEWFLWVGPEEWERAFEAATGRRLSLWPRLRGRCLWTWAVGREAFQRVLAWAGGALIVAHMLAVVLS